MWQTVIKTNTGVRVVECTEFEKWPRGISLDTFFLLKIWFCSVLGSGIEENL